MNQQTVRTTDLEENAVAESDTRLGDAFNKLRDAIAKLEIVALNKNKQSNEIFLTNAISGVTGVKEVEGVFFDDFNYTNKLQKKLINSSSGI